MSSNVIFNSKLNAWKHSGSEAEARVFPTNHIVEFFDQQGLRRVFLISHVVEFFDEQGLQQGIHESSSTLAY